MKQEKERVRYRVPDWCIDAKIELVKRNWSVVELSKVIGKPRSVVSDVINGTRVNRAVIELISNELGISNDY